MKTIRRIAVGIQRLAVGACIGFLGIWPFANVIKTEHRYHLAVPLLFIGEILAGFLIAFISSVAVHELGHVIAGKLSGFRFAFLAFWPIQICRKGSSNFKIRLLFKGGVGLGGLTGMVPVAGLDLRKVYLQMLIGGPLASFLTGLAGISIAFLLGFGSSLAGSVFWLTGLISLWLFLKSMFPNTAGGYLSDGAAIRLLRTGTVDEIATLVALLEVSSQLGTNHRPSQINNASIDILSKMDKQNPMYFRGQYFCFLYAADRLDLPTARMHMLNLTRNLSKIPLLLRANYLLQDAMLSTIEGDHVLAREKLNRVQAGHKGLVEPGDILAVEALIFYAISDYVTAKTKAQSAIWHFNQSMIPEAHAFAKHLLQPMLNYAEVKISS